MKKNINNKFVMIIVLSFIALIVLQKIEHEINLHEIEKQQKVVN